MHGLTAQQRQTLDDDGYVIIEDIVDANDWAKVDDIVPSAAQVAEMFVSWDALTGESMGESRASRASSRVWRFAPKRRRTPGPARRPV